MKKDYLEVLRAVAVHGIKGELKCELLCDGVRAIKDTGTLYRGKDTYTLVSLRDLGGGYALAALSGIDSPEKASALRGAVFYAARGEINVPEGSYFISDIIGLPVYDNNTGRLYGELTDVLLYPANEIYEIKTPDGTVLYPHVPSLVARTDTEKGIFITPTEGFFKDEI